MGKGVGFVREVAEAGIQAFSETSVLKILNPGEGRLPPLSTTLRRGPIALDDQTVVDDKFELDLSCRR